jgi:hypothetical protein
LTQIFLTEARTFIEALRSEDVFDRPPPLAAPRKRPRKEHAVEATPANWERGF